MLPTIFWLTLFSSYAAAELAMYWGQNSAGSQQSLGEYCKSATANIFLISFIYQYGHGGTPMLQVSSCNDVYPGTSIPNCPSIGQDIKTCQSLGKRVLVSMGGAAGSYGFSGDADAKQTAHHLWEMFGGGSGSLQRPFGDAVVDGFDLDIEAGGPSGYTALVEELRSLYASGSRQLVMTAAPQCVFPDAMLGNVLDSAAFDYVFVQFYNNPCSPLHGDQFNWNTWENWASTKSKNKNVKLLLGLPAAPSAAGSGYMSPQQVQDTLNSIKTSPHFGGIMLWDASQAFANSASGQTFAHEMRAILGGSPEQAQPQEPQQPQQAQPSQTQASQAQPPQAQPPQAQQPQQPQAQAPQASAQTQAPAQTAQNQQGRPAASQPDGTQQETTLARVAPLVITSTHEPQTFTIANYKFDAGTDTDGGIVSITDSPHLQAAVKTVENDSLAEPMSSTRTVWITSTLLRHISRSLSLALPTSSTYSQPITSLSTSPRESSETSAPPQPSLNSAAQIPSTDAQSIGAGCPSEGASTCIDGGYAVCDHGIWTLLGCAPGTICIAGGERGAYCGWPKREVSDEDPVTTLALTSLVKTTIRSTTTIQPTTPPDYNMVATSDSDCFVEGSTTCIDNGYAVCDHGKWARLGCAAGTSCIINEQGSASCSSYAKRSLRERGIKHYHRSHGMPPILTIS